MFEVRNRKKFPWAEILSLLITEKF